MGNCCKEKPETVIPGPSFKHMDLVIDQKESSTKNIEIIEITPKFSERLGKIASMQNMGKDTFVPLDNVIKKT